MRRSYVAFVVALLFCLLYANAAHAQENQRSSAKQQSQAITVRSNLVLVPALVKNKASETVFSLTADDFALTDDGIPQPVELVSDRIRRRSRWRSLVQTGGFGALHLADYGHLGAVLDAVIGAVPHRIAVIGFDSAPRLELDFTSDTDAVAKKIASLDEGDPGTRLRHQSIAQAASRL